MQSAEMDEDVRRLVVESEAAKKGLQLLLNCQFDEAGDVFLKERTVHPCAAVGYGLTQVLRFLTSFDDEHKRKALETVRHVEHDCRHEQGVFKSRLKVISVEKNDIYHQIAVCHLDVALADCYLYQSAVIMMNMDVASYVKGGWYVRKAWKLYDRLRKESERLMKARSLSATDKQMTSAADIDGSMINCDRMVRQLYCTVSFGYGLFNLFLSILSPQVLKFISFLGFSSSRRVGLECLSIASNSEVMRAPLAVLTLLWFHTVARPFFALDGAALDSGVAEAERLMCAQNESLSATMLFVFFKGRIRRLQSNIPAAISHYENALKVAVGQAELQQMCQYELGWCYLHLLQWKTAATYFLLLKENSKWLPSYYCYLCGLCFGAADDSKTAKHFFDEIPKLVKRKSNPIEQFISHRVKRISGSSDELLTVTNCILYLLETMYLWRAVQNLAKREIQELLIELNKVSNKHLLPLKCLMEGVLYAVINDKESAARCLEECLVRCENVKDEKHWFTFASYELAYLMMHNAETRERARNSLIQIRDKQRGYFFENRLNLRVHAALKVLENAANSEKTN